MKHVPDESGVYAIRNTVNMKVYVGSASKSLRKRLTVHRQHLRGGYHFNRHLQRAWSKYGEGAFEFVVLVLCSPENCVRTEQIYITVMNAANKLHGYNARPRAESTLGMKQSDEAKAKISKAGRRRYESAEERAKTGECSRTAWEDPESRAKRIATRWPEKRPAVQFASLEVKSERLHQANPRRLH